MLKLSQLAPPSEKLHGCGSFYGRGRWRKRKGMAQVRLEDGEMRLAEVHWYEAHGIGRKEFKIKRYID